MFRWVVLALLLSNTIYFLWQYNLSAAASVPSSAQPSATAGAQLVILGEEDGSHQGAVAPRAVASSSEPPPRPICHMVGPFKEKISAYQVRDRLIARGITVNTYQVNIPTKPDFWVHLGPMRSRREALDTLRELQTKKIDSFLITEGELINGISLGFYTRKELAEAVMKQRREQGYDARIRTVPRFSQQLWEVLADSEAHKLTEDVWRQVAAGTKALELRKNSCDMIASAEKLD